MTKNIALGKRQSSLNAALKMQSQHSVDIDDGGYAESDMSDTDRKRSKRRPESTNGDDQGWHEEHEDTDIVSQPRKKQKSGSASKKELQIFYDTLFGTGGVSDRPCKPPRREHGIEYHRPLLLEPKAGRTSRDSLLAWFDTVSSSRKMPWRKEWIDPKEYEGKSDQLRTALERRAYEVWISEIMLQQTRVAVVIDYWNRWMAKWPTIHDLARASPDDVLSAWRGLGYYSRATRIHGAAQKVVADEKMQGLLPSSSQELQDKVPGVGRYTAGAISSIVFGLPAPMVDGNVLRVLSRQLGLYDNVKTSKKAIDILWGAADALVTAVARDAIDGDDIKESDRPGRWGQALMELGSTICSPKPDCTLCPIRSSCRAYGEGRVLAAERGLLYNKDSPLDVRDIEDLCTLCEPLEEGDEGDQDTPPSTNGAPINKNKQVTLSSFSFTRKDSKKDVAKVSSEPNAKALDVIINHAKKFPVKVVKKAIREEEVVVCAILQQSNGLYLIQRRPEKGMWLSKRPCSCSTFSH